MISWLSIGFLVVLYMLWDLFYREGYKGKTTNGELVVVAVTLIIFGPISVLWTVIYELDRATVFSKLKSWWNRGI